MKALLAAVCALAFATGARAEDVSARPEQAIELAMQFMKDFDREQAQSGAQVTAVSTGRETLALLVNVRDVLGLPRPELRPEEAAQMDRLIAVMPRLAGRSGRFDRADLDPILKSVAEDLEQEVGREIRRQASAHLEPGTFGEALRRRAVEAHLEQHGEAYLARGMEEGRRQVRDGLGEFFHRTGTASAAPEPDEPRALTLEDLRAFGRDARVLEKLAGRSEARGLPRFTFPNGMSVDDLKAIKNGEPPPNGQLRR